MIHPVVRTLLASAAVAAGIALAGCNADDISPTGRAMAPLSEQTTALVASKNMDKYSPILIRIFKQEAELEIWKQTRDGTYALLKTYPICRWSGDLGPKKKEGDRQAPEGFYTITPAQMNPNSNYYLAFNTGYPNAYDRSHGYTGSELMVHGDCSSRGCYAMTDKQIQEIYALARNAFFGGQREFQFEAFPFRMTALNMAKHRNNPNFAFWKMLKQGYDDFEATRLEPKVNVCNKHYVFDAAPPANSSQPLNFNARGKCPVYRLDPAVAQTVLDYRRQQQIKMANYIAEGVATAPPHVGDGGSNPVFAQALNQSEVASANYVPGALPRVPNPPGTTIPHALPQAVAALAADRAPAVEPAADQPQLAMTTVPLPTPAPLPKEGAAPPQRTTIASVFGNLFHSEPARADVQTRTASAAPTASGLASVPAASKAAVAPRGNASEPAAKPEHKEKVRTASAPITLHSKPHKTAPPKPAAVAHNVWESAPAKPARQAKTAEKPPVKEMAKREAHPHPQQQQAPVIRTAFSGPPAGNNSLMAGAQPVMPAGSFSIR